MNEMISLYGLSRIVIEYIIISKQVFHIQTKDLKLLYNLNTKFCQRIREIFNTQVNLNSGIISFGKDSY